MSTTPDGADRSHSPAGPRRTRREEAPESRSGSGARQRDVPATVTALVRAMAAGRPDDAVGAALALALAEASGAAVALVLGVKPRGRDLVARGAAGLDVAEEPGSLLALGRRAAAWVLTTGKPLAVARPAEDLRFAECAPPGVTAVEAIPAETGALRTGAIALLWLRGGGEFDAPAWERARESLVLLGSLWLRMRRSEEERTAARRRLADATTLLRRSERRTAAAELIEETAPDVEAALGGLAEVHARLAGAEDPETRRALLDLGADQLERLRRRHELLTGTLGGVETGPFAVDLNELVEQATASLVASAEARRVRFRVRYGLSIPPLVLDGGLFRRMLGALVGRLVNEAPASGRVRVETVRRGGTAQITLLADGPRDAGRTMELLWSAFETGEGSALSTETAVELVGRHHGRIEANSDREWATAIRIALPLERNRDRRRGRDRRRTDRRVA